MFQTLRKYDIMNVGGCQMIIHPKWKTHIYTSILFTNSPLNTIIKYISKCFY